MKYFIVLVFCLGVRGNSESKEEEQDAKTRFNSEPAYYDAKGNINPAFDINIQHRDEIVSNEKYFYRPCPCLDYRDCIRDFLVEYSDCKPAYGQAPDPLYLPQNTVFFPLVNMTNILGENTVTGLNSTKLNDWYYNRKTRCLVISATITNLNETIQKSIYRFYRRGMEPVVTCDFATVLFKLLHVTCTVPTCGDKLSLELMECWAFIDEKYPDFYIGPKARASKDHTVRNSIREFYRLWPKLLQEGISTQITMYMTRVIQKLYCDFGVEIRSI